MESYQNSLRVIESKFNESWKPLIVDSLNETKFKPVKEAVNWLKLIMEETVPSGKKNRGIAMLYYYQNLKKDRTEEDDNDGYVVAWCIEMLQATALIADDIMDGSLTRRGQTCWYLREGVGTNAINDVLMLENAVYFLLKKYFRTKPFYHALLEICHDTSLLTSFGQCIDTKMGTRCNFQEFTLETYRNIVEYKTSYYSFYSPLAAACILAGVTDQELYDALERITVRMGYLFQVQDDYLDCYGDPKVTGKVGTDIVDGKCTWLMVQALQRATKEQASALQEFYGSKAPGAEENVKKIYETLGIGKHFLHFEKKEYREIMDGIDELPDGIPKEPLYAFLDKIYKRQK